MKNIFLLSVLLFTVSSLSAQLKEYKKDILQANDYLAVENYNKAASIYDELLKEYPDDEFVIFKAGECYLFSEGKIEECIELLEKSIVNYPMEDKNSIEAIEARYYLGQAYHLNYRFEDALKVYNKLLNEIPEKRDDAIEKVNREIEYCKNAIELQKTPVEFKITNMGPLINTEYDEHSPVVNLVEDLLLFTSNRQTVETVKMASGISDENVYYSKWRDKQWITSQPVDLNTRKNNATIGLSPDGTTLLIYQNAGAVGNIYTSQFKNDKWGELEKLPSPINTISNETHASFTMDGNTLYFSSDRAGGYGGKDIYKVSKLPNGEWGKVINLGPEINTELDEASPYIHPKGDILYFSSEGHKSMGGFDIFKVTLKDDKWTDVKNIGYPINTPFDDLFYAPTLDEQRVYYASKRDDGYGGSDLYFIEFPGDHPNALTVVGGFVFETDGDPAIDAKITVRSKKDNTMEGVYRPSPNNGKYIFIIPSDQSYTMEIETDGYKTLIKDFKVPAGKSFARRKFTYYLDPIVLKEDKK